MTVVIAGTQGEIDEWRGTGGDKRAKAVWSIGDLKPAPATLVRIGTWFNNPVAHDPRFYEWSSQYGGWPAGTAEGRAALKQTLVAFPGATAASPG
jgi:hypothetical protein